MAAFRKHSLKKPSSMTGAGPNYSETFWYSKIFFGMKTPKDERVTAYVFDASVSALEGNFKMFEDMPRVHEWPINKLIQRELDQQRASYICRGYLLADGYLKYFPPLTAVLIPTDNIHVPSEKYTDSKPNEQQDLETYIRGKGLVKPGEAAHFEVVAGGIYDVGAVDDEGKVDETAGYFLWDKNAVTAVIIDGQHRYKALLEAMREKKDFKECRVPINLIDLVPICKREKKEPTAVARDLFVTINNTPVEVDEARLVLMDDRDALATFTQVLVDDSDMEARPAAVPPELIDWKCEQGKHDIELSLTGVLTLRGVISSAIFDNKSISSVDSRSSKTIVNKWLTNLTRWINPDERISKELQANETLKHRFKIASEKNEASEDSEEEYPFLFSYSGSAAELMKKQFSDLYLNVFREVYHGLIPYKETIERARTAGAFEKNNDLHAYLRAFAAKRRGLESANAGLRQQVIAYKNDSKKQTQNSIPHTVMGQKAIFRALFEIYLSTAKLEGAELLAQAASFVKRFNETYILLHLSATFDENFYSTRFRLKKGVETVAAGDLGREFWKGIILGYNGEIDYGPTAVDLLKWIQIDVMLFDKEKGKPFKFRDHEKIVDRHIKYLGKFNGEITPAKAGEIANSIVAAKEKALGSFLG